jgi:dynein heavy chain
MKIQPATRVTHSNARDELNTLGQRILDLVGHQFDVADAKAKYATQYEESLNIILIYELQKFNKLTRKIKSTLLELQNCMDGI